MDPQRAITEALVLAIQTCALACSCGWLLLAGSVALRHFAKGPTQRLYITKDDFIKRNQWLTKRIKEIKNGRVKNA